MDTVNIGQSVPDFSGITADGQFQLSALRGKNIVIYFYPKDSTPGCTIESQGFRDHLAEFSAKNTVVVGVSRDSIKSHCRFAENHKLTFSLISDEDESICRLFGVLKQKSLFGKKYMGIERSTFLIESKGVLRREWRNVSVLGHVKEVLSEVSKLC